MSTDINENKLLNDSKYKANIDMQKDFELLFPM